MRDDTKEPLRGHDSALLVENGMGENWPTPQAVQAGALAPEYLPTPQFVQEGDPDPE